MEEYRHQSDAEIKQHDLKKNLILPSSVNQTHIYYEQKNICLQIKTVYIMRFLILIRTHSNITRDNDVKFFYVSRL